MDILDLLSTSARYGTNDITAMNVEYAVGVTGGAAFILFATIVGGIVWIILWCTAWKFKHELFIAPLFFTSGMFLASTLVAALYYISQTNTGVVGMLGTGRTVTVMIDKAVTLSNEIRTIALSIGPTLTTTQGYCSPVTAFNPTSIQSEMNQIADAIADIASSVTDISTEIKTYIDAAAAYVDMIHLTGKVVTIISLLYVSVFSVVKTISLVFRPFELAEQRIYNLVSGIAIVQLIVYCIGGIVISLLAFVLADVCAPGIDTTLKNVLASVQDVTVTELCTNSSTKVICEYQSCNPGTPISFLSDVNIGETLMSSVNDTLQVAIDAVPSVPPNTTGFISVQCINSLEGIRNNQLLNVKNKIDEIVGLIDCESVNKIYVDGTHVHLCDNFAVGAGGVFLTFTGTVIGLVVFGIMTNCV